MARLLKELPVGDKREKGSQLLERLHVMKDKNVFKLLKQRVDIVRSSEEPSHLLW